MTDTRQSRPDIAHAPCLPARLIRLGAVAGALLALLILYGTLNPQPPGPPLTGHTDKLVHFLAFGALSLVLSAFSVMPIRMMVPLVVAYGGAIELVQPSFGRTAAWGDFWANNAGVAAGVLVGLALNRALRRRYAPAR